ncbi:type II restriction endonuclease [Ruegeria lacuscaerulensis]|uniref:type II restriction endonuclease n=1 Tax=Ruegeria lacuscaerulensis TaxID=55218 RepID=UPI00147FD557|nr:type II restriction endonuclease [Ruegeria lacuscaerulensis]
MKFGVLSDFFEGAGAKVLSEVEVNRNSSNQHEFQGVSSFRRFLGTPEEKKEYTTTFYWLTDEPNLEPVKVKSFCTWSDVRRSKAGRSPEYHLYYAAASETVVNKARAGDQLVLARKSDGELIAILSPAGSTIGQQLLWLFGLDIISGRSVSTSFKHGNPVELGLAARSVLSDIGVEVLEPEPDAFDRLIGRFGRVFPGTRELSAFARETAAAPDPLDDPDSALLTWMEHEEALFRHLEREIVSERLQQGFLANSGADVDGFLSFSLSVQNRRKSRAGLAFGHHVEKLLELNNIHYTREATTEKRAAADFLFPGEDEYADTKYPVDRLAFLAIKTSCKDRWRQVLAEADRISVKHLLTLEPAISTAQTSEMRSQKLQLVLPDSLHDTYLPEQRDWLLNVRNFLDLVRGFRGQQGRLL